MKKWICCVLVVIALVAWYIVPVWWGGYSGFRVYRSVIFISENFPRAIIAVQARHGANLAKIKDKDEKPPNLKKTLVDRGIDPTTIYFEEWQVFFDSKSGESTLYFPLSSSHVSDVDVTRQEILAKLEGLIKTKTFLKKVKWDGHYIIATYQTL